MSDCSQFSVIQRQKHNSAPLQLKRLFSSPASSTGDAFDTRHKPLPQHVLEGDAIEVIVYGTQFGGARRHLVPSKNPNYTRLVGARVGTNVPIHIGSKVFGGKIIKATSGPEAFRRQHRFAELPETMQ